MPLYLCSSPADALSQESRRRISKSITDQHCTVTGAPPDFVHVVFFELEQSKTFQKLSGGWRSEARVQLFGSIRSGRSDDAKRRLISGMRQDVAQVLELDVTDVAMNTRDIEARWVMEGGELLPEPGEESAWLERHTGNRPAHNKA